MPILQEMTKKNLVRWALQNLRDDCYGTNTKWGGGVHEEQFKTMDNADTRKIHINVQHIYLG